MWPPHNPITYSPLYGGRISSYLCKYMLSLDMAQDSTMTGSWPSWWYLSWSRASPASNGPGATLSWQGCFQSQGQSTSHLSSCFPLPRLPSQDFFRIVTSHIWHRSIFGGAACAIRSIPGKLLRPCQPSISLCQRTNYFTFPFPGWMSIHLQTILTFDVACVLWGLSWTHWGGTKQHWKNEPMSSHARQSCRAKGVEANI